MSYLIATDIQHTLSFAKVHTDLAKLEDANVFAVLKDGSYCLFKVSPPNEFVTCYISRVNDTMSANVRDVFGLVQRESISWCEI